MGLTLLCPGYDYDSFGFNEECLNVLGHLFFKVWEAGPI